MTHSTPHTHTRSLPAFLLAWVSAWSITVCIHALSASELSAQTMPNVASAQYIFDHISDPKIAQNVVYSIVQDSHGFMWFGTKDGLYRYDGYRFRLFTTNPLDSTTLSDDRVLHVYEDHDGDLWCATQDGGLNRFNRRTATFTRFLANPKKPQSISSNRASFIYQDRTGRLWVGTEFGLNVMNKKTGTFSAFKTNPDRTDAFPSNNARCVCETRNGDLWFGSVGGGICKFQAATGTFTTYQHDPKNPKSIPDNTIHDIAEDAHGVLWLATPHGLCAFYPTTGEVERFVNNAANMRSLSENIVWDVYVMKNGSLWVATQNGLNLFNPASRDFTRFTASIFGTVTLANNYINALYEDSAGRLWVAMYGGGVSVYDPWKRKFPLYQRNFEKNPAETLVDNNIWSAHETRDGNIWLGTVRGLSLFHPTNATFQSFHADTLHFGSMSDNFNSLTSDSSGKVFCGSYGGGVSVFDPKRKRFIQHFGSDDNEPRSLLSDRTTAVLVDKAQTFWVGTIQGLCRYAPTTNDFDRITGTIRDTNSLSHNNIKCFFEDSRGRFWVGTAGGLNLMDRITGKCTRFLSIPTDTNTLSHNNIRTVTEDSKHQLWVATSGGLNRIIETNENGKQIMRFQRITTKDGLPNNLISGLCEDRHGRLWISHNTGIVAFDPAKNLILNYYDVDDGLQGQEFRAMAIFPIRDGRLLFGGGSGLNLFNPDSLQRYSSQPRIVLTNLRTMSRNHPLPIDIAEAQEIILSYKDYIFSIEFAALEFTNTHKVQYTYKLNGFDNDWVQASEQRTATYTNLSGGTYVFRVRASNHDGVWNNDGIALTIRIVPPFWETWWFRISAVLGLICALVMGVSLRERGIKRQNTRLEQIITERTSALKVSNEEISKANEQLQVANAEKNEFLGIVAHDLKNPLSTIQLAARMMQKTAPELGVEDVRELSGDILTSSNRMFDLITNLLDVNRLEQNTIRFDELAFDIVPLVERTISHYKDIASAKTLVLHCQTKEPSISALADESATMQVLDNIVSNAVKYSPQGKNIYVSVGKESLDNGTQIVQIAIRDEGPGISEEDMTKLFGKFARLTAKPTGGEHSTGLGLSIVKKIVEAMNGRVYCQSRLGEGATFIVELPVAA
jgi:signal transduction histidine kinase/ligand-binding sensor domain-containing protein